MSQKDLLNLFLHEKVSFFLHPGESLESGVQKAYILEDKEAVLIRSLMEFVDYSDPSDPDGKKRKSGEMWMIQGFLNLS